MNEQPQSGAQGEANRDGLAAVAILIVAVLAIALVIFSIT
jgi:hypothetical protein